MQVSGKTRLVIRLQNAAFYVLLLGAVSLGAWLSAQHRWQSDWTAAARNTLSESSQQVLNQMPEPINLTVYLGQADATRQAIVDLVARYQRHKSDISLEFINPETSPSSARELGISSGGEMIISYQGREQRLQNLSENTLTNALQRLLRSRERWVVFLSGHGERNPNGKANHDLEQFAAQLRQRGLQVRALNLVATPKVPDNTDLLVIAGPQVAYLPGEVAELRAYLSAGGNLLWLTDPNTRPGLDALWADIALQRLPGVVVDAATQLLQVPTPDFALVTDYPAHPITQDFVTMTLFPQAAGLEVGESGIWQVTPLLQTLSRSWTETGTITGEVRFDEDSDERVGPIVLGVTLERRQAGSGEQRIVVVGDGDFLSNAYLGNGGNLELGVNMINWLNGEDELVKVERARARDVSLALSQTASALIGLGFLLFLPLALLAGGFTLWWRRRRR
jgi:ABC-type uncharacterized transport system involved in gliding motility auxiliary subunit